MTPSTGHLETRAWTSELNPSVTADIPASPRVADGGRGNPRAEHEAGQRGRVEDRHHEAASALGDQLFDERRSRKSR
jgi:hypothetical protein